MEEPNNQTTLPQATQPMPQQPLQPTPPQQSQWQQPMNSQPYSQTPYQPTPQQPTTPKKPKRTVQVRTPVFVCMIILDVLGVLFIFGACLSLKRDGKTAQTIDFAQVADKCGNNAATINGDSDSLSADITYDGFDDKKADKAYNCLVSERDSPSSTVSKIANTRTLDGTQSDAWESIKATWSYSADMDSSWGGGTLRMTFEHAD